MAVEVVAGSVVAHGGSGVGVAGGDLDVAEVDAGVEHCGDVGVAEHVRMQRRHPHPGCLGEVAEAAGGRVPVHPLSAGVEQDRPRGSVADRGIQSSADGGWQGDEGGLVALAEHSQNAVAVFVAEVGDVQPGGFEDPETEEPEQADQREVGLVR